MALELIHSSPSKKFWKKKQRITDEQAEPAWEALYQAYDSGTGDPETVDHQMANRMATDRQESETLEIKPTDACPGCGEPKTNRQHPMIYATVEATHQWNAALRKCDEWMLKNHTQPELHKSILEGLRSWRETTLRSHQILSYDNLFGFNVELVLATTEPLA
jgi:hypothetical protein